MKAGPTAGIGLVAAGVLTCGMALYHFWLPYAFHWGEVLTRAPMLRWGLFIINASFSFLLLAGGVMSLAIALRPGPRERAARWVLIAMAGYWLFNAAYQVVFPMPLPPRLAGLHWGFLGFAAAVALLYVAALSDRRPAAAARVGGAGLAPPRSLGARR